MLRVACVMLRRRSGGPERRSIRGGIWRLRLRASFGRQSGGDFVGIGHRLVRERGLLFEPREAAIVNVVVGASCRVELLVVVLNFVFLDSRLQKMAENNKIRTRKETVGNVVSLKEAAFRKSWSHCHCWPSWAVHVEVRRGMRHGRKREIERVVDIGCAVNPLDWTKQSPSRAAAPGPE